MSSLVVRRKQVGFGTAIIPSSTLDRWTTRVVIGDREANGVEERVGADVDARNIPEDGASRHGVLVLYDTCQARCG